MSTLSKRFPCDGNGDDDAYNKGWNDCLDALAAMEVAGEKEKVFALSDWLHRNRSEAERGLWAGDLVRIVRLIESTAPPSPIDPAAVLALADRLEGIVDACAANGADRIEGMDTAISELRALATGGQDGR